MYKCSIKCIFEDKSVYEHSKQFNVKNLAEDWLREALSAAASTQPIESYQTSLSWRS